MQALSVREQKKRDRRDHIFRVAMALFASQGFHETTFLAIAKAAGVSRGTVFNYYPYKEAILVEHLANRLSAMQTSLKSSNVAPTPTETLYVIFDELGSFVEANKHLVLPLCYELLNPDPERSTRAFVSLPLVPLLYDTLTQARERELIRDDFSRERLARTLANVFFLTALQWTAYRQDRPIRDELEKALKLTLEGIQKSP